MPNEMPSSNKSKKIFLVLGLVIIVIFIAMAWVLLKPKSVSTPNVTDDQKTTANQAPGETGPIEPTKITTTTVPELKDAKVVVPGANPISKDNKVLTMEGKPVKNDALPMAPEAPRQTLPVDVKTLPSEVVKINASSAGFVPNSFTVKKGQPVTLSLTSTDGYTHVIVFNDASLSAVAMGVAPNETRVISFNAPTTAGKYTFRCTVPGHEARGESGTMIVQ